MGWKSVESRDPRQQRAVLFFYSHELNSRRRTNDTTIRSKKNRMDFIYSPASHHGLDYRLDTWSHGWSCRSNWCYFLWRFSWRSVRYNRNFFHVVNCHDSKCWLHVVVLHAVHTVCTWCSAMDVSRASKHVVVVWSVTNDYTCNVCIYCCCIFCSSVFIFSKNWKIECDEWYCCLFCRVCDVCYRQRVLHEEHMSSASTTTGGVF